MKTIIKREEIDAVTIMFVRAAVILNIFGIWKIKDLLGSFGEWIAK